MAHREHLIKKAKQLGETCTTYVNENSTWNGDGFDTESGYFEEDGVVRFAGTRMEIFETYDEIDTDILEECIDCALDIE